MSRRSTLHVQMSRGRRVVALVACVASIAIALPPGQASAQRPTARGHARAFALFSMQESPHEPGRWDPCTPIGYRVNRTQATRGAVKDVRKAIHRVSKATGLTFVYRGRTTRIPQAQWTKHAYPADTQLIIAWIRPSQSTLMPRGVATQDTLAGRGGAWHVPARDKAGRLWGRYDRGYVLLNAGMNLPAGFRATGRSGSRGRAIMHELGHVVGLDHPRTRVAGSRSCTPC